MNGRMETSGIACLEARACEMERASLSACCENSQLASTINAAELYMKALRLSEHAGDRKRLDEKCKGLLTRAEALRRSKDGDLARDSPVSKSINLRIPQSTRKLTTRENIILLEGSKLNGFIFKPWHGESNLEDFVGGGLEPLFTDSAPLALSESQLKSFAGWKRPPEALANMHTDQEVDSAGTKPAMLSKGKVDLIQDMTSDCSVVASLCACMARAARGHPKILRASMYPYDYEDDHPAFSPSGRYVLKLNFNGCWRRVEIDDLLPTSNNSRVLHVVDRSNPGLLWPALVEKAYLKVRGGYDFPGSNSGTDLAVLTGWIPQQIFLHDEDVEQDQLWPTLFEEFHAGNILLTMGTGKLPKREQTLLGLAAEHDYAVLDMIAEKGRREMLVKNPWSDGDVWLGAARRRPNPSQESTPRVNAIDSEEADGEMMPGTFWMDFGSVFQHFQNIYVNWNPGLFAFREDIHFPWDPSACPTCANLFTSSPQFAVRSSKGGNVWVLLNRHFKTGDYKQARNGQNGYISLYVFKRDGFSVISSDGAMIRGPFVDSPNTLVRLTMPPKTAYTVVVAGQDLPQTKCNYTLSAFAEHPVELSEAFARYRHESSREAVWARTSAGGNSDSPHYLSNPQFSIALPSSTDIALVLNVITGKDSRQRNVNVKVLVVFSDGSRIAKLRSRDVVANSGDYRRASAVIQATLDKGSYTIICSTFDAGQRANFSLTLHTAGQHPIHLIPLPAINSGRLSVVSPVAVFDDNTNRLLTPMTISRVTRATFVARSFTSKSRSSIPLYTISIEQGQGPYKHVLASSASDDEGGEPTSASGYPHIKDMDLRPDLHGPRTGGLWLVLKKSSQASSADLEDAVEVEILTEECVEVGPWGRGDG